MILQIWKNPMLSINDRYEAALEEIDRLNALLDKSRVLLSALVEEERVRTLQHEKRKINQSILSKCAMRLRRLVTMS